VKLWRSQVFEAQKKLFDRLSTASNGGILRLLLTFWNDIDLPLSDKSFSDMTNASNLVYPLASAYETRSYTKGVLAGNNRKDKVQIININAVLHCAPYFFSNDGCTALVLACLRGHESIVRFLLRAKVDVSTKTATKGQTAFHFATCRRNMKICKMFQTSNVDPKAFDCQGLSPLY